VVCAWIGNTELIAAKHYLQVTDGDFDRAVSGAAKSDAESVQIAVQQAAAPFSNDTHKSTEGETGRDLALVGAGACEDVQNRPIPPRGLEPLS
jgi:hypothetical protein